MFQEHMDLQVPLTHWEDNFVGIIFYLVSDFAHVVFPLIIRFLLIDRILNLYQKERFVALLFIVFIHL